MEYMTVLLCIQQLDIRGEGQISVHTTLFCNTSITAVAEPLSDEKTEADKVVKTS